MIIIREATYKDMLEAEAVSLLAMEDLRKVYRPRTGVLGREFRPVNGRLVAEKESRIVGTVQYRYDSDRLHIIGLMVHPQFRRQGIARALINALADIAREQGIRSLSLYTVRQTGNVEIFERLGFRVVNEMPADDVESVCGEELTEVYMKRKL